MNIYKVSQDLNDNYDTWDSFVCVAENENDARSIHPSDYITHIKDGQWMGTYSGGVKKGEEYEYSNDSWVSYNDAMTKTVVELIGVANADQQRGVILASFNAG